MMTFCRFDSRPAALALSALALLTLGTAASAAPAARHSDTLYRGTALRRGTGLGFTGSVTTTTGTGTTTTTGTGTTTTTTTGTGTTHHHRDRRIGRRLPRQRPWPRRARGPLRHRHHRQRDATAGTITVTPTGGGTASVLAITSGTVLIGHQTIAASAIALGDRLEVIGLPLTIQATAITVDHLTTSASSGGESSSGGASSSGTAPTPGSLRVIGVVSALSPPTVTVDNSFSVVLSLTSGTTYAEVLPVTLSQLTAGEAARAQVTGGGTGTLTATFVDVTAASS